MDIKYERVHDILLLKTNNSRSIIYKPEGDDWQIGCKIFLSKVSCFIQNRMFVVFVREQEYIYIFLQFLSRETYLNIEDRDSRQWLENVNCLEQGSLCEALQHK